MLRNYLLIAWRNLLKNKVFSLINIVGLAIGMSACLLIVQYVSFELNYDQFHEKGDRIYRVRFDRYREGKLENASAWSSPGVGPAMQRELPEVESFTRLWSGALEGIVSYEGKKHYQDKIFFADASVFTVFSYPFVQGNPQTALSEPFSLTLSASTAQKWFGKENPIGKVVELSYLGNHPFKVTGVFRDIPEQAHLKFNVLLSIHSLVGANNGLTEWNWNSFYTYLLLKPATDPNVLEAKLPALIQTYKTEKGTHWKFSLQALKSIHLHSHLMHEAEANGHAFLVYALLIIAGFILVVAWINYINLSTAKAIDRAKEVGIRKAVGANRMQLIRQFMAESLLINILAMGVAFTLFQVAKPFFNQLTGHPTNIPISFFDWIGLGLGALFVGGSLLSGAYPAFFLSGFRPVAVLKGKLAGVSGKQTLRKSLVVFQFAIAVILITATWIVYRQVTFMRTQYLGMNLNQVLAVKAPRVAEDSLFPKRVETFKEGLRQLTAVKSVSETSSIPGDDVGWGTSDVKVMNRGVGSANTYSFVNVDDQFLEVLQLRLVTGRNFSAAFATDDQHILLNEAAAKQLGFEKPEMALNQFVQTDDFGWTKKVIGVIKNYNQESLRNTYKPIVYMSVSQWYKDYYLVKLSSQELGESLPLIQSVFKQTFPGSPFNYFFLDSHFNRQYQADQQFGQVFGLFAGLAILVACLGLFGLASLTTTQRTKEIGIRKVLGASVGSILALLSKDFLKLVLVANILAWPIAYWGIAKWLENYAFRIPVQPWLLLLPSLAVLVVAFVTVSFQTFRAAKTDPVQSLRYE